MENPTALSDNEIKTRLAKTPGWTYADNKLKKEFSFDDFMDAIHFISGIAPYFEEISHHPDIHIFYNNVLFELQRFDMGGKVTDKDFLAASEIEKRFSEKKKAS